MNGKLDNWYRRYVKSTIFVGRLFNNDECILRTRKKKCHTNYNTDPQIRYEYASFHSFASEIQHSLHKNFIAVFHDKVECLEFHDIFAHFMLTSRRCIVEDIPINLNTKKEETRIRLVKNQSSILFIFVFIRSFIG